jgi:hypothetical protein
MFDDGSYCEEWSYQRWECQPGEIIYNTNSEEEIISGEIIETPEISDEEIDTNNENTVEATENVEVNAEM